jgi:competence protein ComEC
MMPFAVWDEISATVLTTCLMYGVVLASGSWIVGQRPRMLHVALGFLLAFALVKGYERWSTCRQQKIIIYNIQQHRALDIICGNEYIFVGDSVLVSDKSLQNYNLTPARINLQVKPARQAPSILFQLGSFYQFNTKTILLIDSSISINGPERGTKIDLVVISRNANLKIAQLSRLFDCRLFVFDASNSLWKIGKWQKECEELHLRSYSVQEKGALVVEAE